MVRRPGRNIHTGRVLGFFTNSKMLKEMGLEAPKTWDDLLKPEYKGQIVVANPASSGTAFTFIATIIQLKGEKDGLEYLKKLDGQIKQYPKAGAAAPQMVAMGEIPIGIGYLHEGVMQQQAGYKDIVISASGDGTGYMVDSVALIKGGKEKEAGEKFIDWLLTKEVQNTFINYEEYQIPANKNATIPEVDSFFKEVKLIDYDMQLAGENRNAWVEKWHEATGK
jgi:iron(III) transport system substrate-binding protein